METTHASTFTTGCCPPFDPKPWDEQVITWKDKLFLKTRVKSLFHVPLGLSRKIQRVMAQIEGAGAGVKGGLMLSDSSSPWETDLYVELARATGIRPDRWCCGRRSSPAPLRPCRSC